MSSVKLSIDQNDLLRIMRTGGALKERTGTWDYRDLCTLTSMGLATQETKRGGWHTFNITDAGRAALESLSNGVQDYAATPLIIHAQDVIPFNADNLSPEETLEVIHRGCLVRAETNTQGIPFIGIVKWIRGEEVGIQSAKGEFWRGNVERVQILLTKAALEAEAAKAAI